MRTLKFEGVPEIDDALRKQLTEYGVGVLLGLAGGFAVLTQAANYLVIRPNDRPIFRILVAVVAVLASAHLLCQMADVLVAIMGHFGDASVFYSYSPMYSCMFVLDGLIAGIIQGFYGWRVWNLLGHHYLFIVLFTFLVSFTIGTWLYIAASVQMPVDGEYFTPEGAILSFIAPVVCDTIITICMLISVHRARQRSKETTRQWLKRIALLTVTTNAVTSAFCLIQLIGEVSIFTSADGQPWAGVNILLPILPHVYFATLLTWLLAKKPTSSDSHVSGSDPVNRTFRTMHTNSYQLRAPGRSAAERSLGVASGVTVDISRVRFTDIEKQDDHTQPYAYCTVVNSSAGGTTSSASGEAASGAEAAESKSRPSDASQVDNHNYMSPPSPVRVRPWSGEHEYAVEAR